MNRYESTTMKAVRGAVNEWTGTPPITRKLIHLEDVVNQARILAENDASAAVGFLRQHGAQSNVKALTDLILRKGSREDLAFAISIDSELDGLINWHQLYEASLEPHRPEVSPGESSMALRSMKATFVHRATREIFHEINIQRKSLPCWVMEPSSTDDYEELVERPLRDEDEKALNWDQCLNLHDFISHNAGYDAGDVLRLLHRPGTNPIDALPIVDQITSDFQSVIGHNDRNLLVNPAEVQETLEFLFSSERNPIEIDPGDMPNQADSAATTLYLANTLEMATLSRRQDIVDAVFEFARDNHWAHGMIGLMLESCLGELVISPERIKKYVEPIDFDGWEQDIADVQVNRKEIHEWLITMAEAGTLGHRVVESLDHVGATVNEESLLDQTPGKVATSPSRSPGL